MSEYEATAIANLHVKVNCEACDDIFEYEFVTEAIGIAYSQSVIGSVTEVKKEAARHAAENLEQRVALAKQGSTGLLEVHKCPHCGYLQSWMVANIQTGHAQSKTVSTILGVLMIVVGIIYRIIVGDSATNGLLCMAVGILSGIALLVFAYMSSRSSQQSPNKDWFTDHRKTEKDTPPPRPPLEVSL